MADELEKEDLRDQRDAALDVATGTAVERDMALAQRDRLAAESAVIANQRDAAQHHAVVEQAEAQSSTTAFYVLLAIAVLALVIIAAVYLGQPNPQDATLAATPPAAPAPAAPATPPVILTPQAPPAAPPPVIPAPPAASPSPPVAAAPQPAAAPSAFRRDRESASGLLSCPRPALCVRSDSRQ